MQLSGYLSASCKRHGGMPAASPAHHSAGSRSSAPQHSCHAGASHHNHHMGSVTHVEATASAVQPRSSRGSTAEVLLRAPPLMATATFSRPFLCLSSPVGQCGPVRFTISNCSWAHTVGLDALCAPAVLPESCHNPSLNAQLTGFKTRHHPRATAHPASWPGEHHRSWVRGGQQPFPPPKFGVPGQPTQGVP